MGDAVFHEVVPVRDRRAVPGYRRHLRLFARLQLVAGLCPVRDVGPDLADEGDPLRIRKPPWGRDAGRHVAHTDRLAAVRGDHVELRLLVLAALGYEGDVAPVRAPRGLGLVAFHAGEALRISAGRRDAIEIRVALVVLGIEARDAVDRELAVRRDR